jgi:hypothetical protein
MSKILFIIVLATLVFNMPVLGQVSHKTENIFIITFDGLRWQEMFSGADSSLVTNKLFVRDPVGLNTQFWASTSEERREILLPFFWSVISKQGQLYGNRDHGNLVNCTNHMWFSYPGYNEILSGHPDDLRIKSNNKILNPNVTVLEFLNQQPGFKGKVAAFGSWDVFPYIIHEERSGVYVNAGSEKAEGSDLTAREKVLNEMQDQVPTFFGGMRLDVFTHHYLKEYVMKRQPRAVYVSYGETDDFAHDGRYDSYLNSARQTDAFIRDLWEWTQSQPKYRNKTTFIITTDHGRGTEPIDAWKSHGTEIAGSDQIWFAVIGPDTKPLGEIKTQSQLYQKQIAKTAAAFLGFTYSNGGPVGEVIALMMSR